MSHSYSRHDHDLQLVIETRTYFSSKRATTCCHVVSGLSFHFQAQNDMPSYFNVVFPFFRKRHWSFVKNILFVRKEKTKISLFLVRKKESEKKKFILLLIKIMPFSLSLYLWGRFLLTFALFERGKKKKTIERGKKKSILSLFKSLSFNFLLPLGRFFTFMEDDDIDWKDDHLLVYQKLCVVYFSTTWQWMKTTCRLIKRFS